MGLSLVWIIISWLFGVVAGLAWELPLIFMGAGFGLLLILSLLFWCNWQETNVRGMLRQERKQQFALGLMTLLSMLAGSFWSTGFQLGEQPVLVHRSGEQVELIGQAVSPVKSYASREVFLLRATRVKEETYWRTINELVEVVQYSYGDQQHQRGGNQVAYGQQVQLSGQVRLPIGARNPGEFDYSRHLAYQRIYSQIILTGEPVVLASGSKLSPLNLAAGYKEKSIAQITQVLPGREGSILAAMTFGWREGLTEADKDLFAQSGLIHVNHFSIWTAYKVVLWRKTKETSV
jgi:predicted membrane metal-binding protein